MLFFFYQFRHSWILSTMASSVCSRCLGAWTSSEYRTCTACRQQKRKTKVGPNLNSSPQSIPSSSGPPSVCTSCLHPWLSHLYRTCDKCRSERKRQRINTDLSQSGMIFLYIFFILIAANSTRCCICCCFEGSRFAT